MRHGLSAKHVDAHLFSQEERLLPNDGAYVTDAWKPHNRCQMSRHLVNVVHVDDARALLGNRPARSYIGTVTVGFIALAPATLRRHVMFSSARKTTALPHPDSALPGRATPLVPSEPHRVTGHKMTPPYPAGLEMADFGLGCFWGAERKFWQVPGVYVTAVGYQGGFTPNATYAETCSGRTGHTEAVRVVFDPTKVGYETLLKLFWESHDPTQGMRQGNDAGTQYRSAIYTHTAAQQDLALASRAAYQAALAKAGRRDPITTEIATAPPFYFAEDYHQQYLAKNPGGYCGLGGTGVSCPIDLGASA